MISCHRVNSIQMGLDMLIMFLDEFCFMLFFKLGDKINVLSTNFSWQPRDSCYVAGDGLSDLKYSGYQPHAYSWDDYPPLKDILAAVRSPICVQRTSLDAVTYL